MNSLEFLQEFSKPTDVITAKKVYGDIDKYLYEEKIDCSIEFMTEFINHPLIISILEYLVTLSNVKLKDYRRSLKKGLFFDDVINTYCIDNEIKISGVKLEDYDYSDNSIFMYKKEIAQIPVLSNEEQISLIKRIKEGDEEARNILIEHNLKLVVYVAKNFLGRGIPFLDLVQDGTLVLIRAIDYFDYKKGVKFSTYAITCIFRALSNTVYKNIKYNSMIAEIKENDDNENDDEKELIDLIPSDVDVEKECVDKLLNHDLIKAFERSKLTELEKAVLIYRFGLVDDVCRSLGYIANIYGYSREGINQIENRALKKLRNSNVFGKDYLEYKKAKEKNDTQIEYNKAKEKKDTRIESYVDIKSVYELLNGYTKEQVDEAIASLNEEDRDLLYARYGGDLENPRSTQLSHLEQKRFYRIIHKLKIRVNKIVLRDNGNQIDVTKRHRNDYKGKSYYECVGGYPKVCIDYATARLNEKYQEIVLKRFDPVNEGDNLTADEKMVFHSAMAKIRLLAGKYYIEEIDNIFNIDRYLLMQRIINDERFIEATGNNETKMIIALLAGIIDNIKFNIEEIAMYLDISIIDCLYVNNLFSKQDTIKLIRNGTKCKQ